MEKENNTEENKGPDYEVNEQQGIEMAMKITKLMGKDNWFNISSLTHRSKKQYGSHTMNLLADYGLVEGREIGGKPHFRMRFDEEQRLQYYRNTQQALLESMSVLNKKINVIENKKWKRIKEIDTKSSGTIFKLFDQGVNAGPDCLCSFCGKPILDLPVRYYDPEHPDKEYRLHQDCYSTDSDRSPLKTPVADLGDNAAPLKIVNK